MSTTNGDNYINDGYGNNSPVNNEYNSREENTGNRMEARRPSWSPLQILNMIVGILFTVVGAIALTRTGLHLRHAPSTQASVMGMHFTSLSALVVLAVGVLLALSAAHAAVARTFAWLFGIALLAFGIIVAATPRTFAKWWHFDVGQGVILAIAGAVLLLGAAMSPTFVHNRETTDRRTVVQSRRHQPTI